MIGGIICWLFGKYSFDKTLQMCILLYKFKKSPLTLISSIVKDWDTVRFPVKDLSFPKLQFSFEVSNSEVKGTHQLNLRKMSDSRAWLFCRSDLSSNMSFSLKTVTGSACSSGTQVLFLEAVTVFSLQQKYLICTSILLCSILKRCICSRVKTH